MKERFPLWLRPRAPKAPQLAALGRQLVDLGVHTVCQSARCPNLGECFGRGEATFMIMGDACTRRCRFCAVGHARPRPLDASEPRRVAETAGMLGLRYVVITSVTRDDLPDGGARHFAETVGAVRATLPGVKVEVLVPDFGGDGRSADTVLDSGPDVFGHNLETVARLYPLVRPEAGYRRSLDVLAGAASADAVTKSGLMVGLGETEDEILAGLRDLRAAGVSVVTIGQYLQPTRHHLPAAEYVRPAVFARYEEAARALGFSGVLSGPLVRSSYHAADLVKP